VVGALSGINMVSGAGMLETLACHSLEKLVLDSESIASAQRLARGVNAESSSLAVEMFAESFAKGGFLKLESTRQLFQSEQYLPSQVIDREPLRVPGETLVSRAHARVEELLTSYQRPPLDQAAEGRMLAVVAEHAHAAGLEGWPGNTTVEFTKYLLVRQRVDGVLLRGLQRGVKRSQHRADDSNHRRAH